MTKDKLLVLFCQNENQLLSGEQLAREIGVSRNAVWKSVAALRKEGFHIASVSNKGYVFLGHDDTVLSAMEVKRYLKHDRRISVWERLNSTNVYMKQNSDHMIDHEVVMANEQTAGRGKYNGYFASPAGTGIYMSIYVQPALSIEALPLLTWRVLEGLRIILSEVVSEEVGIKWPNNLIIGNRTLCGVLTNCSVEAESGVLQHAVIGIGLHVNDDFSPQSSMISLKMASGHIYNRHKLAAEILDQLMLQRERLSHSYLEDDFWESINRHLCNKGETVFLQLLSGKTQVGKISGVDHSGALEMMTEDGSHVIVKNGEKITTLS